MWWPSGRPQASLTEWLVAQGSRPQAATRKTCAKTQHVPAQEPPQGPARGCRQDSGQGADSLAPHLPAYPSMPYKLLRASLSSSTPRPVHKRLLLSHSLCAHGRTAHFLSVLPASDRADVPTCISSSCRIELRRAAHTYYSGGGTDRGLYKSFSTQGLILARKK